MKDIPEKSERKEVSQVLLNELLSSYQKPKDLGEFL